MANFNKTIGKRRADTASVEYSMQQLGLLPIAYGQWVQRRCRGRLIAIKTCTAWSRLRGATEPMNALSMLS
jgi:hypothetical protein